MRYEKAESFICRYCGCRLSKVTHTWVIDAIRRRKRIKVIKRRRVCKHCGLSFTTIEYQVDD